MTGTVDQQVSAGLSSFKQYPAPVEWTAAKIKQIREARGWSQRALAEALTAAQPEGSVSARSITDWERGKAVPSGRNLSALDRVLGDGDRASPGRDLSEFADYELLAEIAARLARGGRRPADLPTESLRWATEDAPAKEDLGGEDDTGTASHA